MTTLTMATLFPLDTVAAGDQANGTALVRRAHQRGIEATLTAVNRPEALVPAQIYLVGGDGLAGVGELVDHIRGTNVSDDVRSGRSVLFAVDAGLAAVGRSWTDAAGVSHQGLGLVGSAVRATPPAPVTVVTRAAPSNGLPAMIGWCSNEFDMAYDQDVDQLTEIVTSGPAARPRRDGVLSSSVIGTQLHGPVLALNPELADLILAAALRIPGWEPLPIPSVEAARSRRISELAGDPQSAPRHAWELLRNRMTSQRNMA